MISLAPTRPLAAIGVAEIAIARQIQSAFLPARCKGCKGARIAARRLTSGSIGGDFHDFIVGSDGRYSLIIGDVVGHGVHSALAMALVLGAIRALGSRTESPLPVVHLINELLCRINDDLETNVLTTSLFYGVVDRRTQTLQYCNAGHPYPLMATKNGVLLKLWATCRPLGVAPEIDSDVIPLSLRVVERALFYTDGLTEARSPSGEFLGVDRIGRVFERTAQLPIGAQADALMDEVARHAGHEQPLNDDATAIVASFGVRGARQSKHARG
jgi:sigma-B regulation protein RsbU (phosphoserine phosphatase)